jgi:hypothetical protein
MCALTAVTGVYNGPLDWRNRPCPSEQHGQLRKQVPWQWRRERADLKEVEVDYDDLLRPAFQPHGDEWREGVRDVVRTLLHATDAVVKAKGLQFRAVEQPDQEMWFPAPQPTELQVRLS